MAGLLWSAAEGGLPRRGIRSPPAGPDPEPLRLAGHVQTHTAQSRRLCGPRLPRPATRSQERLTPDDRSVQRGLRPGRANADPCRATSGGGRLAGVDLRGASTQDRARRGRGPVPALPPLPTPGDLRSGGRDGTKGSTVGSSLIREDCAAATDAGRHAARPVRGICPARRPIHVRVFICHERRQHRLDGSGGRRFRTQPGSAPRIAPPTQSLEPPGWRSA